MDFPCSVGSPLAYMLPPISRQDRWISPLIPLPSTSAFPEEWAGRLLRCQFRGMLSVYSSCSLSLAVSLIRPLYIEGSSGFVTSTTASIAIAWSDPVLGRNLHPRSTSAFSQRTTPLFTKPTHLEVVAMSSTIGDLVSCAASPVDFDPMRPHAGANQLTRRL